MKTDRQRNSKAISVLVVDDHPAVRQGLGLLLEPEGITVCAEAGGRAEALACIEKRKPSLAVVDLSLGDEDGTALVADLRGLEVPALVYSMHEEGWRIQSAFAAGALGYVTKREIRQVLVQAIREVAARQRFVSPRAAVALANHVATTQADAPQDELSAQEREVYRFLGEGQGPTEIATSMNISTRTVESYFTRILVKLGLNGMRELRRHAINHLRDRAS